MTMSDLRATLITLALCAQITPTRLPEPGFFCLGSPVVPVLLDIREVDDALTRANRVPEEDRGELWASIVDALLDRRVALATVDKNLRDIRIMRAAETR